MTVESDIADYLQERRVAAETIKTERRWLALWARFCNSRGLSWSDCTQANLLSFHEELLWISHRSGRLYTTNTLDFILRSVRSFYRWAHRTGRLAVDPTAQWRMPRPPQVEHRALSQPELLRILNLPDLSLPSGQRDQVFLELLYYAQLPLAECLKVTILGAESMDEAIQPHLRLYLQDGRPKLSRGTHPELLLSRYGTPFINRAGFRHLLRKYSPNDLPSLTPSLLHRSHREHKEQLTARRLPPQG